MLTVLKAMTAIIHYYHYYHHQTVQQPQRLGPETTVYCSNAACILFRRWIAIWQTVRCLKDRHGLVLRIVQRHSFTWQTYDSLFMTGDVTDLMID